MGAHSHAMLLTSRTILRGENRHDPMRSDIYSRMQASSAPAYAASWTQPERAQHQNAQLAPSRLTRTPATSSDPWSSDDDQAPNADLGARSPRRRTLHVVGVPAGSRTQRQLTLTIKAPTSYTAFEQRVFGEFCYQRDEHLVEFIVGGGLDAVTLPSHALADGSMFMHYMRIPSDTIITVTHRSREEWLGDVGLGYGEGP